MKMDRTNADQAPFATVNVVAPESYRLGDLVIDADSGRVLRGEHEIELPRLSWHLLLALIRAGPAILSVDELMDRVWPGLVVGPETVSQRVKLLRDALGDDAQHPRYIAGVRGRGYRLATTAQPLCERRSGTTETTDPAGSMVGRIAAARRPLWLSAALLTVLGLWLFGPGPPWRGAGPVASPPSGSIAVLPFVVRATEGEAPAFFAEGMHDDLLTRLTRIPNLRVISRTSVMPYGESDKSLRQIGAELGVDTLLEGSVQQAGDQIRINAQLIDARSDEHIWARTFDRQLTVSNLLAIQSEIAEAIAGSLHIVVDPDSASEAVLGETGNLAAYSALLAGHEAMSTFLSRDGHTEQLVVAEDRFRRALSLDPQYARAHAGLAQAIIQRRWLSATRPLRPEDFLEGRLAAERALTLAPGLPDAHLALAQYYYYGFRDYDTALAQLHEAEIRLPGSARIAVVKGWILLRQGRAEDALSSMQRAVLLDPRSLVAHVNLARVLFDLRRYDELTRQLQRMLAIDPEHLASLRGLATVPLLRDGDVAPLVTFYRSHPDAPYTTERWRAALIARDWQGAFDVADRLGDGAAPGAPERAAARALTTFHHEGQEAARPGLVAARESLHAQTGDGTDDPMALGWLAMVLAALGERDNALTAAQRAVERMPLERDAVDGYVALDHLACVAAMVGDRSLTLASLERLLSNPGFASIHLYRNDPRFESLAEAPGFKELEARYAP
jgi:TolB-like protein/DNA-binding winged helix-turn-helix (wHTH) protein/tetratricopeptide (TPR) repeat protein